jgi:hypothetical protein
VRIAAAAAAMGGLLWAAFRFVDPDRIAGWRGAGILSALIAASAAFYWLVARGIGAPEPAELARVARRKRARTGSSAGGGA